MNPSVTVGRLFERLREPLQLEQLSGEFGHDRMVANSDISSPGLALAGFVARFVSERPQVLGETEMTYLVSLTEEERRRHLELFLSFPIPCLFITKGLEPASPLMEVSIAAGVPVFRSSLKTNEFYRRAKPVVEELSRRLKYTPSGSKTEMLDRLLSNLESIKTGQSKMDDILTGS